MLVLIRANYVAFFFAMRPRHVFCGALRIGRRYNLRGVASCETYTKKRTSSFCRYVFCLTLLPSKLLVSVYSAFLPVPLQTRLQTPQPEFYFCPFYLLTLNIFLLFFCFCRTFLLFFFFSFLSVPFLRPVLTRNINLRN